MAVQDYKINYKSDFVLTINGDAGWAVPFCIKFWTGAPVQAYFVGFDGVKYVNCKVGDTPTQLLVMFDDHHLPIGKLKMQIAYHTTIAEFPGSVFDEVTNARDVIVDIDGTDYQVMLDFTGEDAPELEFDLPAYANEAERIQNELQRQQNEAARIEAELEREQASAAAVQGAENVNAQLSGNILTVTNRNGVSTSVNTKGEQGEQGPVGPEGPQGEQGVSIVSFQPVYESGTFTYYNITFSNGHYQSVAIPKGAKGDTGATGPQGPQGETGVSILSFTQTGTTETDLIYTITFSNGTTQQVNIPKGAKGDTGATGPQGNSGYTGAAGELEVVNNLTQGGATAALSAEMGKELSDSIGVLSDSVNITQLFDTAGWTNKKFIVGKQDSTHPLGDMSTSSSNYSFASGYVNISGYDLISITLPQLNEPLSTVGACFYDANHQPISGMYKGNLTPRDMVAYNFKVPEGAVYVRATKRTDSGFASFSCHGIIGKSVKDLIDELDSYVNPSKSIPFSLVNGLIDAEGNYVYESGLKVTDNIDVSNIRHIYYSRSCYNSGAWLDVAFYDSSNNFIVGESVKNTSDSIYIPSVVLVPNGAVTARFTFKNSDRYGMRMILDADTDASLSRSLKFNEITSFSFTDNKAADTVNGNVVNSTIHKCSDLIDIKEFRGGKLFYPRVYQTISYSTLGLCFYDSNQNFISGVPCAVNSDTIRYTETTIDIPSNAFFVRCSALMDVSTYGDFYIELCAFISNRINILEEKSNWSEYNGVYSPKECNVRFYKAMEEKCLGYGIEGAIIEGPGGYGRADNTSDEVPNPVLGHGMAQLPVYGLVKIVSNCLNYPILKDIWNSSSHIIYTKGIEHELIVEPSIDGTYGHYLKDYYTVLTWKTGTNENMNIRNLALTATSDDLKGVILSAFVHFSNSVENDTYNRYKAMKLLLDIGKKLFFDRNADISQEVSLLNAQTIGHAQVAVCPNYPAFMIDWDLNSSTYYKLWEYNGGTTGMNTFSVIKLLTAQVVLDYVKDLDEYVDVLPYDIWIAPYSAPIFTAGEKVTYRDLLYAMLFPSSNQASYILSRNIGNLLLRTYRGDGFLPQ